MLTVRTSSGTFNISEVIGQSILKNLQVVNLGYLTPEILPVVSVGIKLNDVKQKY